MTINHRKLNDLHNAVNSLKAGTGERGQYRAFLGDGRGVGNIINSIPPTYREVWIHTGNQSGSQAAGQQVLSLPLSWLASLLIPYVNDPQYENMPVVVGYAPGSSTLEVLRPDGLGAATMLRNPGVYARQNWLVQPPATCQGRLTSTSGQPSGDAATFTTLYFTPYNGNLIGSFNGYTWRVKPFSETSLSLSGFAANTNFDIFWVDTSNVLTYIAWSTNTARAWALVLQNGILLSAASNTYRYLGTIRTTGTIGQSADNVKQRFIWNAYNHISRQIQVYDTAASWAYATAAWRQANANAANKFEAVTGLSFLETMHIHAHHLFTATANASAYTAVGVDSTTAPTYAGIVGGTNTVLANNTNDINGAFDYTPTLGYHTYNWLEQGAAGVTFYGTQLASGLSGFLWS